MQHVRTLKVNKLKLLFKTLYQKNFTSYFKANLNFVILV